jgi:hypothetical protein
LVCWLLCSFEYAISIRCMNFSIGLLAIGPKHDVLADKTFPADLGTFEASRHSL